MKIRFSFALPTFLFSFFICSPFLILLYCHYSFTSFPALPGCCVAYIFFHRMSLFFLGFHHRLNHIPLVCPPLSVSHHCYPFTDSSILYFKEPLVKLIYLPLTVKFLSDFFVISSRATYSDSSSACVHISTVQVVVYEHKNQCWWCICLSDTSMFSDMLK